MAPRFCPTLLLMLTAVLIVPPGDTGARPLVAAYTVTDLGTLGGATSRAYAVNEQGHVAGSADTSVLDAGGEPIRHAFLWRDGRMMELGTPAAGNSEAYGLNDRDDVVGRRDWGAFLWRHNGAAIKLQPGSDPIFLRSFIRANAINNSGQIVGFGDVNGSPVGFVLPRGQPHHYRQTDGTVVAINRRGEMAGLEQDDNLNSSPVTWKLSGGRVYRTRRLAPWMQSSTNRANSLNNHGLIVGELDGFAHLWRPLGSTRLGTLPGFSSSYASSINDAGEVVGVAYSGYDDGYPIGHGFLWGPNSEMVDLNSVLPSNSGWILTGAAAINNHGQIVGTGLHNGIRRAFLLTPR